MSGSKTLVQELKRKSLWRWFFGKPVAFVAPTEEHSDKRLGFVETGDEAIDFVVNSVQDGRNVMLVGPRGTGKSYMAARAVERIQRSPSLGNVAVITIQGDPNKPPSDYIDDAIVFRISKSADDSAKVLPETIPSPFFNLATRDDSGFYFKTTGGEGRGGDLILQLKTVAGELRNVDRLVIFWDEGNRSSPALQNAMLGLLADRTMRRDGRDYRFPPVSCILTRNPDGYDAQSAKMPQPLVDRFGSQLYVYNPTMSTMVDVVSRTWLKDYRRQLTDELARALSNAKDAASNQVKLTGNSVSRDLQEDLKDAQRELIESSTDTETLNLSDLATDLGRLKAVSDSAFRALWAACGVQVDETVLTGLINVLRQLPGLVETLSVSDVDRFERDLRFPSYDDPLLYLKSMRSMLEGTSTSAPEHADELKTQLGVFDDVLSIDDVEIERVNTLSLRQACVHLRESIHRYVSCPQFDQIRPAAELFALVILGSWGDARTPEAKAGMQYLPQSMRDILDKLAKQDRAVQRALKRLGDRTRYGTSIRAFVDMLQTLVGEATRKNKTFSPAKIDLDHMKPHLGRLLNHRCEPSFNPDREPAKAKEKTEAIVDIADYILYGNPDKCRELL